MEAQPSADAITSSMPARLTLAAKSTLRPCVSAASYPTGRPTDCASTDAIMTTNDSSPISQSHLTT